MSLTFLTLLLPANSTRFDLRDVENRAQLIIRIQLDIASYITSSSISPTSAYMAFGDADGTIHLMSQAENEAALPFNGFDGQPIEWADTPAPLPEIEWSDST